MTNDVSRIRHLFEKKQSSEDFKESEENLFDGKEENPESKTPTKNNPSDIGKWSENVSWQEKKKAAPLVDFLEDGQLIICQNNEMIICDSKDLPLMKGEYKIIFSLN